MQSKIKLFKIYFLRSYYRRQYLRLFVYDCPPKSPCMLNNLILSSFITACNAKAIKTLSLRSPSSARRNTEQSLKNAALTSNITEYEQTNPKSKMNKEIQFIVMPTYMYRGGKKRNNQNISFIINRKMKDVENENGKPGVTINTSSVSSPKPSQLFQIYTEEKGSND